MCDDSIALARAHLASLLLPAAKEERTTAAYALDQAFVSNLMIITIIRIDSTNTRPPTQMSPLVFFSLHSFFLFSIIIMNTDTGLRHRSSHLSTTPGGRARGRGEGERGRSRAGGQGKRGRGKGGEWGRGREGERGRRGRGAEGERERGKKRERGWRSGWSWG